MLSSEVQIALNVAVEIARERSHEMVTTEHLLSALLLDEKTRRCLEAAGSDVDTLDESLDDFLDEEVPQAEGPDYQIEITETTRRVITRAVQNASASGRNVVEGPHVVVAMFSEPDSHSAWFLEESGVTRLELVEYLSHQWADDRESGRLGGPRGPARRSGSMGRPGEEDAEGSENLLREFAVNLNERAQAGKIDKLIGRTREMERTIRVLARRRKNNPLYIGEPGVGKTALAEGLARRIVDGEVPDMLKGVTVYALDMGSVVAGTRYRGDFEKRLKGIIAELQKVPRCILFIDEIHTILRSGAVEGGSMDAANLLKPALADGSLRCIGATTWAEYRTVFQKDEALNRRFQRIEVEEPSIADSIEILKGLMPAYATFHGVTYLDDAIEKCVSLSAKYMADRRLPDKAVDLLDESGVEARLRQDGGRIVDALDVERVVARIARIPEVTVTLSERDRLRRLDEELRRVVFGQNQAIDELVAAVKLARSGLNAPERPLGSFLFTGPTGVGKTEVARQLAETMGLPLLRFDMSEYSERVSVSRLIGASPGYVGYDQGGQLTEAVTRNPNSIVLLDEIEKAHPEIYNVLLQVMDRGRLTDNQGREADFRNVILIMTSNVGARELDSAMIGFSDELRTGSDDKAFEQAFSPEFRNRLDARIKFSALQPETMEHIVRKFVAELRKQLAEKEVEIELTEEAVAWFAKAGFDRKMGARPMARVIRERLKRPLADELLFGELERGGKVLVTVKDDAPAFECTPKPPELELV